MKLRKVISAFLVLICLFATFGLCTLGVSAAEGANIVYATTNASVKQGSYGYLYVYLDDLTDLAALNMSVYYDAEKITVENVYNKVPSVVNDLATGDGCVNASYIFDGKGSATKTNLFYIYYQVNNTADVGETYFDIVVNEAFDSALKPMDFTGSRCAFEIAEKTVSKSCTISSTSKVSTSVGEEFELSYRLSTYQIASGSMKIQYDPELFEVVSVTNGGFLTDKIADVNTALDGTVSISFVGTTYQYKYDVITVRFKTLKNVTEASDIKLVVSEFYDKELNLYSCSGYTTKANIVFDETFTENAPSMSISSSYNAETDRVTATVKLEKNSMLGAGDFVLKFDTRCLSFFSAQKEFSPTFFNINDKDVDKGALKFSIISLTDVTDEQTVLTVVFDVNYFCEEQIADFEISGSGLTDSLTNTITLNFVDTNIIIPLKHMEAAARVENRVEPNCIADGCYDSVVYCSLCDAELARESKTLEKLGHDLAVYKSKAPTCTEIGWNEYETCSRCDYSTYEEISATGHSYDSVVTEPTCTEQGYTTNTCHCGDSYVDNYVDALGHNFGEWYTTVEPTCLDNGTEQRDCSRCDHFETREVVTLGHDLTVHEAKTPTCTEIGWNEYETCSRCDYTTYVEIAATGHSYESVVIAPTCTTEGYTTNTCHCGDSYVDNYVDAPGHNFSEWYTVLAPTCLEEGTEQRDCDRCEHFETREVNTLGHDLTTHEAKAPTCTEFGWNTYETCGRCDYTTYIEIAAIGHSYESVVTAPTCTEQGYTTNTCHCGDSYVDNYIEALGHSYEAVVTEPTCTEKGYTTYTCHCGDRYIDDYVDALGHSLGEWDTTIEPTCLEKGTEQRDCSRCDHSETQEVVALGHDIVTHRAKAPNCTEIGWNEYETCSRCDYTTYSELAATGHNLIVVDACEPTCVDSGWNKFEYCTKCTYFVYEEIAALGHDITVHESQAPTCTEIGWNEYETCSRCDYSTYEEISATGHSHNAVVTTPTCTEQGYTTYTCHCGYSYISDYVDALGHNFGEWYTILEPTCLEVGTEQRDCDRCDHFETREADSLGHDLTVHEAKAPTCTEIGWNEYETCSRCDHSTYEEISATGHNYESVITSPTCTEDGYTTNTCHCGESYVDNYVDALGHNFGEWYTTVEPTCLDNGTGQRDCSRCDHFETQEIAELGHDLTVHDAKVPTCTEIGWNEYETCSRCDYTTYEELPIVDHSYENGFCIVCGGVAPDAVLKGDIDGDGKVNAVDMFKMKLFIKQLLGATGTEVIAADINNDGKITALDMFELKYRLVTGVWRSKED